jgi:hypothetical protein
VGRHTLQNLQWRDTLQYLKRGDTHTSELKWSDALQYLNGETHTSKFKMRTHILQSLKREGTRLNFKTGKHILQNLMWGDTHKNLQCRGTYQYSKRGHTHFKTYNRQTRFNIQTGEAHTSEFKMERRASIFKWGDTYFKI